ncbi:MULTISPECIES: DUF4893 domain-containing protein [unclassified Sphingomonas]|uniref:DUF4893 domain-containing protein n=1 Tax=unclassified Sphingomonas TaxID=196159 RepID=UPI002269BF6F|nr:MULTISPECIES: DUF4893 domain-containing protein [unclassified Sphingomonas]
MTRTRLSHRRAGGAARRWRQGLAAAALVASIAAGSLASAEDPVDVDWQRVATGADRARLRDWRNAWVAALAIERAAGHAAVLAADPLFDPDRSVEGVALPPGTYHCRTVKLGRHHDATRPLVPGRWNPCTIAPEEGVLTLRTGGTQRLVGHLFDRTDAREVFLGTLVLGDEPRAMVYGGDSKRDVAGVLERIGERRWRLVVPYPAFESMLDLVEIAPAG